MVESEKSMEKFQGAFYLYHGAITKYHILDNLAAKEIYFQWFMSLKVPDLCPIGQMRTLFLVNSPHLLTRFSQVEAARELCGVSFKRTAIPVMRAHELMVFQRPHLLMTLHQVLEFQHVNLRETL